MLLDYHIHFPHLDILKNRLYEVYLFHTIGYFAISLFGIFIPIYLLTLGYTLSQVFVFLIIEFVSVSVSALLVMMIAARYGLKHAVFLHIPAILVAILALYSLETLEIPINLIAILLGIHVAFKWLPVHALFANYSHKDHRSFEVAQLISLPTAASIIGPLAGGLIIFFLGFKALFVIAGLILILSVIPLFYTKEIRPRVDFSPSRLGVYIRKYPKLMAANSLHIMRMSAEKIIWPIFVFLTLKDVVSVGIIGALLGAGIVVFTLFIGRISGKAGKGKLLRVGGVLLALVWFSRIYVTSPLTMYLLTFAAGLFTVLVAVPIDTITYTKAKEINIYEFLVVRELAVNLGRAILVIAALLMANIFLVSFSIAGLGSLLFLFY